MYHSFAVKDILRKLNSSSDGLNEQEAKQRLIKDGPNQLPEEKPAPRIIIFLRQFKGPLIFILAIAGLVTLFLKDWADTIVIFAAVMLNSLIGFFQENKTSNILKELKKIVKDKAVVLRDGKKKEINSEGLVKGDIIILTAGDKVPADCRLIESHNLKIDESILTGEWILATKQIKEIDEEAPLARRNNMAYAGCLVEGGRGKATVTATGLATEIGKISMLVADAREEKTPFQRKVLHLSGLLGLIIIGFSSAIFVLGILTGQDYLEMLLSSVAVAVAAVPEGLPAAVTVIFAFGMREILKGRGLVMELPAAEILGSTSIICTDKTGTLTEAKMQVARISAGKKELLSDGKAYSENINQNCFVFHFLTLKIAVLANAAFIENPEDDLRQWIVRGKPTEKALLVAGIQAGINKKKLLNQEPKIDELPFDSSYKFSASLHRIHESKNILYVLGSPEVLLNKAKYLVSDDGRKTLTETENEEIKHKINELAAKGERIVAAAYKEISVAVRELDLSAMNEITFVGLIALKDPLRQDAKESIYSCIKAGMQPIIVTGDHKLTTERVAQELGLQVSKKNILEGYELDQLSEEEFKGKIKDIKIYARMEPRHKIRIVRAWQDLGEVVAMTGDGVNDAPALKAANIGVALGSGTELAKQSSDLILLDNNFRAIIIAIEYGRVIMDNIRKVISFLLVGGFTEIMLISLSVIFRLPLPVLPGQILWKNLIESTPPGIALAFEAKEKDVMFRRPEKIQSPLLSRQMKSLIFIVGTLTNLILFGLFLWLMHNNFPLDLIRSMIFVGLAIDSFFFIFSCRNLKKNIWRYNPFSNMYVNLSVVFGFVMLVVALYLPVFQKLLKTVPLGLFEWAILLAFGLLNIVLVEFCKWFYIRKDGGL